MSVDSSRLSIHSSFFPFFSRMPFTLVIDFIVFSIWNRCRQTHLFHISSPVGCCWCFDFRLSKWQWQINGHHASIALNYTYDCHPHTRRKAQLKGNSHFFHFDSVRTSHMFKSHYFPISNVINRQSMREQKQRNTTSTYMCYHLRCDAISSSETESHTKLAPRIAPWGKTLSHTESVGQTFRKLFMTRFFVVEKASERTNDNE